MRHLFGCALRDNRAAAVASFRAQIDDPVGGLDHVEIVLDDDHGIAFVYQSLQHEQQFAHVLEVQARGRFVEDIHCLASGPALQLGGELDALRLAAGIEGRTEDAANFDLTPLWEDTDTRTVSQAVDALGKASKMLGVPQEELWDMIPGVTKTRADSWRAWKENHPDADALAVQAYASQLAPATTGGDDGLDR